jgi:hypothetical protein
LISFHEKTFSLTEKASEELFTAKCFGFSLVANGEHRSCGAILEFKTVVASSLMKIKQAKARVGKDDDKMKVFSAFSRLSRKNLFAVNFSLPFTALG